ncbi:MULTISPECIES: hypothetical protein [Bacillus]|uniref:Uncharacterized protein n=3 Tax=Bacillus cereus group TaxID=86661 RepID=A0A7D8H328_9BACI|nr:MULTISPECIES: hypothetical protein [Bacillus]EJP82598.1 hypothetical protein IAU_05814 [Bacillus cereus IS075]EOO82218.1 hypothetical protein IGS_05981 [Bacillus cereus IS845/00]EOO95338.1 hypothetical protein IGQ_04097 [Bacillus cereus IS195]AYY25307.1 hypothetical protein EGX95_01625 [Bacillus sp. FDAARGOS_527]MBE7112123.1 hypothetical protein [Bacillus paranthracis]
MEERTIKFEIVIEGECTPEEQSKVRKMYDFIEQYAKDHGYKATKTAGVKELMENDKKNTVAVKVDVDTKEANENIAELTAAANECVAALEKLERLTNKFSGFPQTKISVHADTIAQRINSAESNLRI